jgi:hypothetical protein
MTLKMRINNIYDYDYSSNSQCKAENAQRFTKNESNRFLTNTVFLYSIIMTSTYSANIVKDQR